MEIKMIPRNRIIPDPDQPRETFEKESIQDLANSMKEFGLLQPILVKPTGNDNYEIIAGERRWRASKFAGIEEVACIIKDVDKRQQEVSSLIENVHREDLEVFEKGKKAYQIFELYGISISSKELSNKIQGIRDYNSGKRISPLNGEEKQIEEIYKKINKPLRTIKEWIDAISISPEIHKVEVKKPKEERIAGSIRARLSTIEDEELQKKVYTKIDEQEMGQQEASRFITHIKKTPEEIREEMLTPGIKTIIEEVEEKPIRIEIPEEEVEGLKRKIEETKAETERLLAKPKTQERMKLRRNWQAHTAIQGYLDWLSCPKCGKTVEHLKWACCDISIEKAIEFAHKKYEEAE